MERASSPSSPSERKTARFMLSVSDTGVGLPAAADGPDLQRVLHDEASRHWYGTSDQPLHH